MTRTILITGTSSGYGKAMAELFLDRGWNVVATMRRPDPAVFATTSDRLKLLPLDVTDDDSIRKAIADGVAAFGAIDVLVNNAGIGMASVVEATPDSAVREIFETNTFGVFATCRAIIPQMRRQGQGVIINVTSSAGIAPMPLVAVYAASKCAVEGFTESLAYELDQIGIKARLVEPGYAPTTNFTVNGGPRHAGTDSDGLRGVLRTHISRRWRTIRRPIARKRKWPRPSSRPQPSREARSAIRPDRTPSSSRTYAGRPRKIIIWRKCGRYSARGSLPDTAGHRRPPGWRVHPDGQITSDYQKSCQAPCAKIYRLTRRANHLY